MDKRVLVVHAGRYGSTARVASAVADELRRHGALVDLCAARDATRVDTYEAVVVGSAVYWAKWLPEATTFVERNRDTLRRS